MEDKRENRRMYWRHQLQRQTFIIVASVAFFTLIGRPGQIQKLSLKPKLQYLGEAKPYIGPPIEEIDFLIEKDSSASDLAIVLTVETNGLYSSTKKILKKYIDQEMSGLSPPA